jgi:hypothetical protein
MEEDGERLYVHGVITYVDMFGQAHETRYRYVVVSRLAEGRKGSLRYCSDGNCMT